MVKLIELTDCTKCPECDVFMRCKAVYPRRSVFWSAPDIPDWCPLPDVKAEQSTPAVQIDEV